MTRLAKPQTLESYCSKHSFTPLHLLHPHLSLKITLWTRHLPSALGSLHQLSTLTLKQANLRCLNFWITSFMVWLQKLSFHRNNLPDCRGVPLDCKSWGLILCPTVVVPVDQLSAFDSVGDYILLSPALWCSCQLYICEYRSNSVFSVISSAVDWTPLYKKDRSYFSMMTYNKHQMWGN